MSGISPSACKTAAILLPSQNAETGKSRKGAVHAGIGEIFGGEQHSAQRTQWQVPPVLQTFINCLCCLSPYIKYIFVFIIKCGHQARLRFKPRDSTRRDLSDRHIKELSSVSLLSKRVHVETEIFGF